jgi:hypothetical protein
MRAQGCYSYDWVRILRKLGLSAKQSAAQVESTDPTHEGAQDASAQGDWHLGHSGYINALCSKRHFQIGESRCDIRFLHKRRLMPGPIFHDSNEHHEESQPANVWYEAWPFKDWTWSCPEIYLFDFPNRKQP